MTFSYLIMVGDSYLVNVYENIYFVTADRDDNALLFDSMDEALGFLDSLDFRIPGAAVKKQAFNDD